MWSAGSTPTEELIRDRGKVPLLMSQLQVIGLGLCLIHRLFARFGSLAGCLGEDQRGRVRIDGEPSCPDHKQFLLKD